MRDSPFYNPVESTHTTFGDNIETIHLVGNGRFTHI